VKGDSGVLSPSLELGQGGCFSLRAAGDRSDEFAAYVCFLRGDGS